MKDDTPVEDDYGDGDIPPVDLPEQSNNKQEYTFTPVYI